MDLEEWIARNLNDSRVSNYEKLFVRNVIPHIDSLSLNAISAQHHFIDDRGKSRYCDFVIQEGDDLKVAIEIDGWKYFDCKAQRFVTVSLFFVNFMEMQPVVDWISMVEGVV